jgi:hypothetical protein
VGGTPCGQQATHGTARKALSRTHTSRPGTTSAPAKLNQVQANGPCTHDMYVHSYNEMLTLAVHQVAVSQVNCNTCSSVHTFYECPSLPAMDNEAQKQLFRAKALEK